MTPKAPDLSTIIGGTTCVQWVVVFQSPAQSFPLTQTTTPGIPQPQIGAQPPDNGYTLVDQGWAEVELLMSNHDHYWSEFNIRIPQESEKEAPPAP